MAWKRWNSYADVPEHVLRYPYNNRAKVEARDIDYLDVLNAVFNPMPMHLRAKTKEGVKCFLCLARLSSAQAEKGRLCPACAEEVKRRGEVKLGQGWSVSVFKGA